MNDMSPTVIRLFWSDLSPIAYVGNVEPQNDGDARDNLLYGKVYDRSKAMTLPRCIAETIVARWQRSANQVSPGFVIEAA